MHFRLLREVHEGHSAYGFPSSRVSVYETTATIPRTTTTAEVIIIVILVIVVYVINQHIKTPANIFTK